MSTSRHRTQSYGILPGGHAHALHYLSDYDQGDMYPQFIKTMDDVIGNPDGVNPLTLEVKNGLLGVTNGQVSYYFTCENWYSSSWGWGPAYVSAPTDLPDDTASVTKAWSGTNPSRPEIDVPVFVVELKDIPDQIRHAGDRLLRVGDFLKKGGKRYSKELVAEDWLQLQFGWAPLIGDLNKMIRFVQYARKRVGEWDRLYSGKGLRRNYTVYRSEAPGPTWNLYLGPSYANHTRVSIHTKVAHKKWVSTVWKPTSAPWWGNDRNAEFTLAKRLVLGLGPDVSMKSIWDAMPWSWLVDWFSNAGDYLGSLRNTIPVTHQDTCIMYRRDVLVDHVDFLSNPYGATFTPSTKPLYTLATRSVWSGTSPLLTASLPFLSGKQLSILSAIATTRRWYQ